MKKEKVEQKNELQIYDNQQVSLSNALIQAREKTSLLESKIELLAIYRMKDEMTTVSKKDAKGRTYSVHQVKINSSEIRQLSGRTGGSLYTDIEAAAYELKQKLYIYRDPKNNQFTMDSLYGEVSYKDGVLTVDFNPATEHLFMNLTGKFTKLRLDIAFKFQTNGGFQMYKLFKSYAYKLPDVDFDLPQEKQVFLEKTYSLSEFRLQLGYVDLNQPDVKKEASKAHPNSDKMAALEKKPKYKRWNDFNARVVKPGVEEVNAISDIYIAGVEKILGSRGKVEKIRVIIQNNLEFYKKHKMDGNLKNEKKESVIPVNEEEIDEFIDKISDIIPLKLKLSEYKAIAKASVYDLDKIKIACDVMDSYNKDIDNVAQFLITAIEENWEVPTKKKVNKRKNDFNDFEQRTYDYDELEEKLRNK